MYRATYLVAGLFKDARRDSGDLPAEKAYEMATLGGARSLGMEDQIGSIEVGKKADIVLHDIDPPRMAAAVETSSTSWSGPPMAAASTPCSSTATRLSTTTAARCSTRKKLWVDAQAAGEAIALRSGLPNKMPVALI